MTKFHFLSIQNTFQHLRRCQAEAEAEAKTFAGQPSHLVIGACL